MRSKVILLGLLAVLLFALAPADAAPPISTFNVQQAQGYVIEVPLYDYIKANNSFMFHWHIFNISTGTPIINNVSCAFHLYNQSGDHIFTQNTVTAFDDQYDMEILVAPGNFSKGFYNALVQCNSTGGIGGSIKEPFEVTNTGLEPATDVMIIFSYLLYLTIIGMFLYIIVYSLEKFSKGQFGILQLVYNMIAFFSLIVTYMFNRQYFGIESFSTILLVFISAGSVMMIVVPIYLFMTSFMRKLLEERLGKYGR